MSKQKFQVGDRVKTTGMWGGQKGVIRTRCLCGFYEVKLSKVSVIFVHASHLELIKKAKGGGK